MLNVIMKISWCYEFFALSFMNVKMAIERNIKEKLQFNQEKIKFLFLGVLTVKSAVAEQR